MEENNTDKKTPFDLNLLIAANGKKMQYFYTLPPEERQKLLDEIIYTKARSREIKS